MHTVEALLVMFLMCLLPFKDCRFPLSLLFELVTHVYVDGSNEIFKLCISIVILTHQVLNLEAFFKILYPLFIFCNSVIDCFLRVL